MADERVDKGWQKQGLGKYSTGAILGTLGHYGISIDEAAFKQLAAEKFPLQIADAWHAGWKGTGQFSQFHWRAAEELWRRSYPDRLHPADFSLVVAELLGALTQLLEGSPDAPVGTAFKKVDALKPRIPTTDGLPQREFLGELFARLGEGMKVFSQMAQKLAKEGHTDDAMEFAHLEEFLFPEWAGVSTSLVRAESGEREQALKELELVAKDGTRKLPTRAAAIDALIQLDACQPAAVAAQSALDEAEKGDDVHLSMELAQRWVFALEKIGDTQGASIAVTRANAIAEKHQAMHPEHHH